MANDNRRTLLSVLKPVDL